MKNVLLCFVLCFSIVTLSSQITIAKQSFEVTGDTWIYTPSPAFGTFTASDDDWQIEDNTYTQLAGMPTDGDKFVAGQDIENNDNPNVDFVLLNFDNISVAGYTSVEIKFDYRVVGYDNGDDLFYTVTIDGTPQTEVKLINGSSNLNSDGTEIINIPDGSVSLSLVVKVDQNGSDYIGLDNFEVIGIVDNTPNISFDAATSSENETNASFNVDIPVTLSNYQGTQVDLSFAVTGGNAEAGDFTLNTTELSFTADGTQNVSVTINDDADFDDETIEITITETSSTGAIISSGIHTLTIVDDETPPELSFSTATSTVMETNADVSASLSIFLSNSNGAQVDVMFEVTGGMAETGDYDLTNPTFSITAGDGVYGVPITIKADADSDDETIEITMSETSSTGALVIISVHTITIEDDETPILPNVRINELDADTPGTDDAEFIELFGTPNLSLDGIILVLFNGSDDKSYKTVDLSTHTLDANGYFILGSSNAPGNPEIILGTVNQIQNGADAAALYLAMPGDFTVGTSPTTNGLIDALVYGTNDPNDTGLLTGLGQTEQINEAENGNRETESIQRGSWFVALPTPRSATIVPVNLTSFKGILSNKNIKLSWATSLEINNDYFDVQRSANMKDFETIGKVTGHGNITRETEYAFTDRNPLAGVNYYRLAQYDFNGDMEFHKVIAVENRGKTSTKVFPTITKGELTIQISEESMMNIMNTHGQIIKSEKLTDSKNLNVADYAPGVYYLQINTNGNIETHKFVKL